MLYSWRMSRALRCLALIAVTASLGCRGEGGERPPTPGRAQALAAQRAAGHPLYWVGRSFDGLALSEVLRLPERVSFIYGSCDPSGSDTGCAPPLEIQVSSICDDNALALDIRPDAKRRVRGTTVLDYGEAGRLALDAGVSHVTVSAEAGRSRRVVAVLRRVGEAQRVTRLLPEPRYPRSYVAQLRRVSGAYRRLGDVRAVRTELGISKKAVRFELALASDLGAQRVQRQGGWVRTGGCQLEPH